MKKSKLVTLLALALFSFSVLVNGCGTKDSADSQAPAATTESVSSALDTEAVSSTESVANDSTEADAEVTFTFTVVDADGNETATELTTSEKFLSGALSEAGIISDDEAEAGFVTTVNDIFADYDADGAWWCLTDETGEATSVGIAECPITDGCSYTFTYTIGY